MRQKEPLIALAKKIGKKRIDLCRTPSDKSTAKSERDDGREVASCNLETSRKKYILGRIETSM